MTARLLAFAAIAAAMCLAGCGLLSEESPVSGDPIEEATLGDIKQAMLESQLASADAAAKQTYELHFGPSGEVFLLDTSSGRVWQLREGAFAELAVTELLGRQQGGN